MTTRQILMIEDDRASRYIFGTILRHHGFEVLEAASARSAEEILERTLPELIVLDLGLPHVDGFEVLKKIRADPRTAAIPVVVVTVHVFPEDEARARAAGCSVFLKKPLAPNMLAETVLKELGITASR
jgi:CheY-like chemotaxis protein